ncbi:MAG: SH3 domain-containing protein [Pseudomonadota bacterium]
MPFALAVVALIGPQSAMTAIAADRATRPQAPAGLATGSVRGVGTSGLAVPRFVSLKAQPVNLRKGPGLQYPTAWVLKRAGMPLEVLKEFDAWRQVRDADGTTGWVHRALLSGRRTATILPWTIKPGAARPIVDVRASPSSGARVTVRFEAGALVGVQSCDGRWCRIFYEAFRGYIAQKALWGVYPEERVR